MNIKNILKTICLSALLSGSIAVSAQKAAKPIVTGADQTAVYLKMLKGKKVGFVGNQTSVMSDEKNTHVVDYLVSKGVNLVKVFAPEHGFRDMAAAGAKISDGVDPVTGVPVVSLYGKNYKPSKEMLEDLDVIVYDIQDVGCRFYTYISTMAYVMEAAAENGKKVIILDRPNPNGQYIDGNILDTAYRSFVGMHPVPIVYGMTAGEYAKMVNGEGWLKNGVKCDLTVIPCKNYDHSMRYSLPILPSPNLPTDRSVNLFPSVCFFEGTPLSEGRGTKWPFEVFGSPLIDSTATDFTFTPEPTFGDKRPKQNGKLCYGRDLRNEPEQKEINLEYIIWAYNNYTDKEKFFNHRGFSLRAGNYDLEEQIKAGMSPKDIKKTWQDGLDDFKKKRKKYLIYKDF